MTGDTKLIIGVALTSLILLLAGIFFLSGNNPSTAPNSVTIEPQQIRDNRYNTLGSQTPQISIVEFSDFQCPACKAASPILKQIIQKYPQVKLIYQHFPLPQHKEAILAAEAAEAAGAQGKFWEMHDLLFKHQESLNKQKILELAKQINGLDISRFSQEIENNTYKSIVLQDLALANKLKLGSTPSIFINGSLIPGGVNYQKLSQIIESQTQVLSPSPTASSSATPSASLSP